MDEVFVEPFDGLPPEREPNDSSPERKGKFLEAETMIALNDLCGRVWDQWLSFGAFQTMEPEVERLGYQINIKQHSRRKAIQSNSTADSEGGFMSLLKMNPERRLSIEVYHFVIGGMHYLKTYAEVDAGGRVLIISRRKSRGDKFLPNETMRERPSVIYTDDSFKDQIYRNEGIDQFFVPMPANAAERASDQMAVIMEVLEADLVKLPTYDIYNTRGAGKDLHPDVGYGDGRV